MLPNEYDTRIKAMLLDEKPTDEYSSSTDHFILSYCDVGGLDKQIQELKEAVVLPLTHAEIYTKVGIRAPKGIFPSLLLILSRCLALWTSWYWQDPLGPCLCKGDRSRLHQIVCYRTLTKVRRRRCTGILCALCRHAVARA